jgi:TPR repeat protein
LLLLPPLAAGKNGQRGSRFSLVIMSNVKILFFAADPLSAQPDGRTPRLLLDEDVRKIQQKVRAAGHRADLFDWRLAARPGDLLQALTETRPRVVHFSGHGRKEGLVLVGADGHPHLVPAAGLTQLFQVFRGRIRLVVLNACFSLEQAEAIAGVVGCAIGTRREISDGAAITFGAEFYLAIASGRSVQAAFERARAALAVEHPDEAECPQLVAGDGVDPSRVFVFRPRLRPVARMLAGVALVGSVVLAAVTATPRTCGWEVDGSPRTLAEGSGAPSVASATGGPSGVESDLAAGKVLYSTGKYAAAFPLLEKAAEAGNAAAMGLVGIAYSHGQGTRPRPDSAISWLRRAAAKRDKRAMVALGSAYENGEGVDRSPRWAQYWYEEAAADGSAEAMRRLGSLFRDQEKYAAALRSYRAAVFAGSADARADAGWMYEKGLGVSPDAEEARCLYVTAAEAGSPRGMLAMGRTYQEAVGVRRDYARAKEWYLKAVRAGSADAMYAIGVLYHNGWGVPRDPAKAIRWYRRARDAGSRVAAGNLTAPGAR